jgi:hypothetical protein
MAAVFAALINARSWLAAKGFVNAEMTNGVA